MKRKIINGIKKYTKKALVSMALAMMITSTLSITSIDSPLVMNAKADSSNIDDDEIGINPVVQTYYINNAQDLRNLATEVNNGNTHENSIFIQTADIDLGSEDWIPIGGQCDVDTNTIPLPGSKHFAGIYDGQNYTISNLKINKPTGIPTDKRSCYGLFGYSTGALVNIRVAGTVATRDPEINFGTQDINAVGAIVGFTTGSVKNCRNEGVDISMKGSEAHYLGGVVGRAHYSGKTINLERLLNTGNVSGRGRVGGVIGGATSPSTGTFNGCIKISKCASRCNVSCSGSRKAWSGGVVGYNQGEISNSYFVGSLFTTGAHYISGVSGILNGWGAPTAKMDNCYSVVDFNNYCNPGYDRPLYGSADKNSEVNISNCIWSTESAGFTQPETTSTDEWGTQTNVVSKTKDELKTSADVLSTLNGNIVEGPYVRETGANAHNQGMPYLKFEKSNYIETPTDSDKGQLPGTAPLQDNLSGIYVDGINGNDLDPGTLAKPVKTIAGAISKLGSLQTIYIKDKVTIASPTSISLPAGVEIRRSVVHGGYLFEVIDGGTLTLGDTIIDGNTNVSPNSNGQLPAMTSTRSLINIESDNGTAVVNVNSGTILRNNYGNAGGAIRVRSGELNFNAGKTENCTAINNKGKSIAVMKKGMVNGVEGPNGVFNLNATGTVDIGSNVYLATGHTIALGTSASQSNIARTIPLASEVETSGTVLVTGADISFLPKFSYPGLTLVHDDSIYCIKIQ